MASALWIVSGFTPSRVTVSVKCGALVLAWNRTVSPGA